MKKTAHQRDLVVGLISVIVPIYNSQDDLQRCLKSILNQSYKKIEIILIDDGSADKSGQICDESALQDKRIKVIHQKNSGPAQARNTGINHSRGEFIFFVDADDFIENNALNLLMANYKKHQADIIIGDFEIKNYKPHSGNKRFLFPSNRLLPKKAIIDCARNYLKKPTGYAPFVYAWGKLFRSSIINDNHLYFNKDLRVFEDVSFIFEYLKFASSAYYVKNHLYQYFVNNSPSSAGMKIYDNPMTYKLALKSIGEFLRDNDVAVGTVEKETGNACLYLTISTMVRFFVLKREVNFKKVYQLISQMVNDAEIRENLKFYSPSKGDSRILPLLIKLKLIWPIIGVCWYKAYKRRKR